VLVIGGQSGGPRGAPLDTSERYDPATKRFRPDATLHDRRYKIGSSVALLPNGDVLVAGGSERAERYRTAEHRFTTLSGSLLLDRHFGTATVLRDATVFVAGGYSMADNVPRSTASTVIVRVP
jgi:hypothetical protein